MSVVRLPLPKTARERLAENEAHARAAMETAPTARLRDMWRTYAAHTAACRQELEKSCAPR